MPIDAYSICPGGTGRKIKFCCGDLLGQLQQINRMLEGEQFVACLKHVEQVRQEHPDRACLLAIKGMLLREAGEVENAVANATEFVEKHPQNPAAQAESAIVTAAVEGGRAAMGPFQRAMAASADGIQNRVYEAMGTIAGVLLSEGELAAGRAMLQLQMAVAPDDEQPVEMLTELYRTGNVPLLFKDDPPMAPCPPDAPWKSRFEEAMTPMQHAHWQAAAEKLSALAEEVPDSAVLWRNLATVRGWLADTPGCVEALERFAALDPPLEDAVEAQAMAMLLAEDPLGDLLDVLTLTWTVRDADQLQAGFSLQPRAAQVPLDPHAEQEDDTPPPKAVYLLLDRPTPESAENLTVEAIPRILGQALLFGRQTDCEARLEVHGVTADDLPMTEALVGELGGGSLDGQSRQEAVGKLSASQELLQCKWRPPRGASAEQLAELSAQHRRRALLEQWPNLKLGIFEGKPPCEIADRQDCRVKLLAAVMVMKFWNERALSRFDFNELRSRLGLPTLEPIDPQQTPMADLPLVRLSRVTVERLSDEDLLWGYRRAVTFNATEALRKFSQALIERPSLAGKEEQQRAYSMLARTEEDPQRALEYIEQGRRAAADPARACAAWDLLEVSLRAALGQAGELSRLVDHLQSRHIEEPGVAEALTRLLVGMGLIRPDGSPVAPPTRPEPPTAAGGPEGGEPGKIWTPGAEQSGGSGKIWTPD